MISAFPRDSNGKTIDRISLYYTLILLLTFNTRVARVSRIFYTLVNNVSSKLYLSYLCVKSYFQTIMICLWNSRYSFFTSFELIELSTPTSSTCTPESILVIVSRIKYKTIRNDTNACSIAHKFQQSISHVFRSKKMLHAFVEIPFGSARFGCKTARGREVAERRAGTIRIGSSQQ